MTAKKIGRNVNSSDEPILSDAISLNSSTSIIVALAFEDRIGFYFSNPSNKDVWLKKQAASVDDDKKGIFIPKNGYWEMSEHDMYPGEFSAIAVSGSPNVYFTEA